MKHFLSEAFEFIVSIVIGIAVAILLTTFVFQQVQVDGHSMDNTLQDGERLFLWKLAKINRFDVVVLDSPDKTKLFVKRVIGMPGDSIEFKDDQLFLNGQVVAEPYLDSKKSEYTGGKFTEDFSLEELTGESTVPEGKVFVMGDNRQNSTDSRVIGFVDMDALHGQATHIIWPLSEFSSLSVDSKE
ncbi:signal peptidase I [Eremococcus coleocola]|uniref:Signal peptidase I n=1 Tax=Eremococcus coleocola ACS-139-V-Col8 TaxID=908337 RepID=E4KLP2_9LACT|nr:signal peptidase I [Eremococcus coleocola]EFR31946.1 signal peptidase I [Eremococcus coleocola ACS-139-V-Col8]